MNRLVAIVIMFGFAFFAWKASAQELQPGIFDGGRQLEGLNVAIDVGARSLYMAVQNGDMLIDNGQVRVVFRTTKEGFAPEYYAMDGQGDWQIILRTGRNGEVLPTSSVTGIAPATLKYPRIEIARNDERGIVLRLRAQREPFAVTSIITLEPQTSFLHITEEISMRGRVALHHAMTSLAFVAEEANGGERRNNGFYIWAPRLRNDARGLVGDEAFGAPAAIIRQGTRRAALIPDVNELLRERQMHTAISVDRPTGRSPWLSYGFCNYEIGDSGLHYHRPSLFQEFADTTLSYAYHLHLTARAEPAETPVTIANLLWQTLPKPDSSDLLLLQRDTFDGWRRRVWPAITAAIESTKLEFTLKRNDLRTAYGVALHAKRTGNDRLMQQADWAAKTVLDFPAEHTVFAAYYSTAQQPAYAARTLGEQSVWSTRDSAETARWLLRWQREFAPDNAAILARCVALADLLVRIQQPSGVIPAWLTVEELTPVQASFYNSGAELAGAAAFLAELHAVTGEERYLIATLSALQHIRNNVMPGGRWIDQHVAELSADTAGGQSPQSTAAMINAAQAAVSIYRKTGRAEHLALARQIAGHVALYQNGWATSWLLGTYGGVAEGNHRLSQCPALTADAAELFLQLHQLTGDSEWLDRGLAAVRAAMHLLPKQLDGKNIHQAAHVLTVIERLAHRHGDAVIDARTGTAYGLDALHFENIEITETDIAFRLSSPFAWSRSAIVRVIGSETPRRIVMNGEEIGTFEADALAAGVPLLPICPIIIKATPVWQTLAGAEVAVTANIVGAVAPEVRLVISNGDNETSVEMARLDSGIYSANVPRDYLAEPGVIDYRIIAATPTVEGSWPQEGAAKLAVTSELTLVCGVDDHPWFISKQVQDAEVIDGRKIEPQETVLYLVDVPVASGSLSMRIVGEGDWEVRIGNRTITPVEAGDSQRDYLIEEANLPAQGKLLLQIGAPGDQFAVLRSLTMKLQERNQ